MEIKQSYCQSNLLCLEDIVSFKIERRNLFERHIMNLLSKS